MTRSPDEWLTAAQADADRRGLTQLKPLLRVLASATETLRKAPWNYDAQSSQITGHSIKGSRSQDDKLPPANREP